MANANLAFSPLAPLDSAPAKDANVKTLDGLPKIKKLALSQVKAHFIGNFKRASLTDQRQAIKNKEDAAMMLVDTYVGYALHKAHSGMGANEPGMSDASAQIAYSKDNKKVTAATEHFKAAFDVLDGVSNKGMAEATIVDFEVFKSDIEMAFMLALIAGPQQKRDDQKIRREASKIDTAPTAPTAPTDNTAPATAPTAPIDNAVSAIVSSLDALNLVQLETLQAAISKAIDALPPL